MYIIHERENVYRYITIEAKEEAVIRCSGFLFPHECSCKGEVRITKAFT